MADIDPNHATPGLTNVPGVSTASTLASGAAPVVPEAAPIPGESPSPVLLQSPGASSAPGPVHAQPGDEEIVYFDGSPTAASAIGSITIYSLISLVLIAIPILYHSINKSHDWPVWWFTLLLVLIALVLPLIPLARLKSIRYRITNYRIDYERGYGARDTDTLELWHVDDIHLHQSLWGRVLKFGAIRVESHDETMPRLVLIGLPDAKGIFETLKQRVIAVKRQRGVIKMDPG